MPKIKLFLFSVTLAGVFTASITFTAQVTIQTDSQFFASVSAD